MTYKLFNPYKRFRDKRQNQ